MSSVNQKMSSVLQRNKLRETILRRKEEKLYKLRNKLGAKVTFKSESFNPSLNDAIRVGNLKRTKLLIQTTADVNKPGRNFWTPLHMAAYYGHFKIVRFLIQEGAKLNSTLVGPKGRGFTPLHLAALKNNLECASLLLDSGASVFSRTEDVCHPIHIAVFKGHVKMAALLLNYGADVNCRFNNDIFKVLKNTMLSDLWRNHNLPLLHCSILKKWKIMTLLLLERGADINLKTSLGKTTLMQAVEVNDEELVKFLVFKRNANVNDRDIFGQPVLHFTMINANRKVSMYSREEFFREKEKCNIVGYLIKGGADVNARFPADQDRSTVVHYMIKYGFDVGVVQLVFRSDFNFEEIDPATARSSQILADGVTPDIENDLDYMSQLEEKFGKIWEILVRWTLVRQVLKLPVNLKLLEEPIYDWMSAQDQQDEINGIKESFPLQIDFMKKTKIGDKSVTFWELLTCDLNKLAELISDSNVGYFNSLVRINYRYMFDFFPMLSYRISTGLKRRNLIKQSTEVVCNIFNQNFPYDCCEMIVKKLNQRELGHTASLY